MRKLPQRGLSAAIAGLLLFLTGCFEQPVTERMYLKFLPSRALVVGVTVTLADEESFRDNPAARRRIESFRRDLLQGNDPWAGRFASLEPTYERTVWDRKGGALQRVTRRAAVAQPESLKSFFADTLIQARISDDASNRELTLQVGHGGRASRAQREEFQEGLGPWVEALTRYLQATVEYYRFLEANPSGAETGFDRIFQGLERTAEPPSQEQPDEIPEPSAAVRDEALTLAKAVDDAMDEVSMVFTVSPDSGTSLEELSTLVYDPFPAPLLVQVPEPILESEGFRRADAGILHAGGASLWKAFLQLEGRWLSPDPLLAKYRAMSSKSPFDEAEFSRRPRRFAAPPGVPEIRAALEEQLATAQIYRVRWVSPEPQEGEEVPQDPETLWDAPAEEAQ